MIRKATAAVSGGMIFHKVFLFMTVCFRLLGCTDVPLACIWKQIQYGTQEQQGQREPKGAPSRQNVRRRVRERHPAIARR